MNKNRLILTIIFATVTIGGALAVVYAPFPQGVKIGGGWGNTGVTVEPNGDAAMDGNGTIKGDFVMVEKADHSSTPAAGYGYLWTESTTPSRLVFTNDAGTDTVLGSGGGVADGDTLSTGFTFPIAGLHILDTNASHDLIISPGTDLTADRTLTLTTGDANLNADLSDIFPVSGTPDGTKFLRDDKTWVTPAGSGDMVLASAQTVTGAKTFEDDTLVLEGST